MCDDRTDLVLNDDEGLTPASSYRSLSKFWLLAETVYLFMITYLCFTHLHAVFPLLTLQIYWAGIIFVYNVRLIGDEGEVKRLWI